MFLSHFRTDILDDSLRWYEPAKDLYQKTFNSAKHYAKAGVKIGQSNGAKISGLTGYISLVAQQGRGSVRAISWKFLVEKLATALLNPAVRYLHHDMVSVRIVDAFIRSKNEELKLNNEMICVTKKTAFQHG